MTPWAKHAKSIPSCKHPVGFGGILKVGQKVGPEVGFPLFLYRKTYFRTYFLTYFENSPETYFRATCWLLHFSGDFWSCGSRGPSQNGFLCSCLGGGGGGRAKQVPFVKLAFKPGNGAFFELKKAFLPTNVCVQMLQNKAFWPRFTFFTKSQNLEGKITIFTVLKWGKGRNHYENHDLGHNH